MMSGSCAKPSALQDRSDQKVSHSNLACTSWERGPQDLKPLTLDPNRHIQEPSDDESDAHPALALAGGVQVLALGLHVCM